MTSAAPDNETIWCLHCGYALDGVSAGPCPECGNAFDPRDPPTFSDTPPLRLSTAFLVGAWGVALANGLLSAAGVWVLCPLGLHILHCPVGEECQRTAIGYMAGFGLAQLALLVLVVGVWLGLPGRRYLWGLILAGPVCLMASAFGFTIIAMRLNP